MLVFINGIKHTIFKNARYTNMKENVICNQEKIQSLETDPQSDPDIVIGRKGLLNYYYEYVKENRR